MTELAWDSIGERRFQSGVDRGVLYLEDSSGVPWNGLTAVSEVPSAGTSTPLYFDGVKFGEITGTTEYSATLKAVTYPDEFLPFEGSAEAEPGFEVTGQTQKRFGLSYRVRVGNDTNEEAGHRIHVICNVFATPLARNFRTINDNPEMVPFEWNLTAIPSRIPGFKPTPHLIFDTSRLRAEVVDALEDILYGSVSNDAYLPSFLDLLELVNIP